MELTFFSKEEIFQKAEVTDLEIDNEKQCWYYCYVFIWEYIYIHTHTYTHIYTHTHTHTHIYMHTHIEGFPCGSAGKESACNAGDLGSIPGLARLPGEGKGYPLQYSGLENSVNGVAKSQTRLRDFHVHCLCIYVSLEKVYETSCLKTH